MTRHPSPHIPRGKDIVIIDATNDVTCQECGARVTLVTDGHGRHVGIDSDNRRHRHDVSKGPGDA